MTTTVKEIIEAKAKAGEESFLALYRDAYCLLWDCEPASICESNAIGLWQLDDIEYDRWSRQDWPTKWKEGGIKHGIYYLCTT